MQKLLIEDDEGKTVAVPLIRDEITIGRQEGNTIRLSEQNVSRRHARLVRREGALLLEDLSSYNGTKLNGAAISASAPLKDGDVFLIGDYRMAIKEDRPSAAVPLAAHAAVGSPPAPPAAQAEAAAPPAAEVRDVMEAQPTIPLHSLADEDTLSDRAPPAARLVIVGRFMEGREFILDRPSLVIGRTPENDIVIEHKSISRHHARIVREGNQYYAVDLESANGVRVNGVDHDRVLLRPGDEIELGQVQLRFATEEGGGEFETGFGRRGKGKVYAIVGGGVAVLAVVLILALSGGRSRPQRPPARPVAVQPIPVPQPPPPPPPPKETLADLLAAAKSAQANEKWDEALVAASKAVALAPDSTEAAELRKLAEEEKGNAERFGALKDAADNSNFDAVLRGAGEIPETSTYKERASILEKSARTEYIKLHLEAASSKASTGACDDAKPEAELVLAVDSANKTARWIISRCVVLAKKSSQRLGEVKKPAAQAPKPAAAAVQPKPAAPAAAQPEPSADPDRLIQQAREAWLRGQYILAVDAARKALRAKPGLTSAYQIIAICSCSLHDPDTALRAYEKLDDRNKQLVRSACQKNGISF
jgi:pSer/pThr/pTyr-binding forkhead associated (FHA) protein/tetratricopeptide (TPR) repeat protein